MNKFVIPSMKPLLRPQHPMTQHVEQLKLNNKGGGSGSEIIVLQNLDASDRSNNTTTELVSSLADLDVASQRDTPELKGGGRKITMKINKSHKAKGSKNLKTLKKKQRQFSSIKNRKDVTKYNKMYRCCYLLKNGQRCKNECVGVKKIKSNKTGQYFTTFVMQCKKHSKLCEKKYLKYKSDCSKVTKNSDRQIFLKNKLCNNKTQKKKELIKNINKCINGRVDYPIKCTNGCIVHPYNFKGYKLIKKTDTEHFNEIVNLIKNKLKCLNI